MHAPVAALAWEFWGRHRWGLAAAAGLVAGFAAYCAAAPPTAQFALVSSIWFVMALCYVLGVFAYGHEARLEAAESGFPARLFVLPVRTSVLVGWPMLQGVAAAVLLWLGWDRFVLRPAGVETPGWWAAMLAAVVATSQALVWLPFGLPWARVLVLGAALTVLLRSNTYFTDPDTRAAVLTWVAAGLIPAAFLLARAGVARARRGDGPGWAWADRPTEAARPAAEARGERTPFASALRAQVWYEGRLRGRGFAGAVVGILAVLVAVAGLFEHASNRPGFAMVFVVIPPLIATFWGSMMGSPGESVRSTALTTFAATRPLGNAALVAAKLWAAARAAALAWAAVLATTAVWLAATDGYARWSEVWEGAVERNGRGSVVGSCALAAAVLGLGTWRALVANLWVGLTGRTWLVPAHTFVTSLLAFQCFAGWATLSSDRARWAEFLDWLPWAAAAAVAVKLLAAAGLLSVLVRRRELEAGAAAKLAGVWAVAAAALFAVLAWLVPPALVPTYALALGVVLALPLARLAAAPLALAWNRHR